MPDLDDFGDENDAVLKDLSSKGKSRTPAENKKFRELLMLKWVRTRAIRTAERKKTVVAQCEAAVGEFMGKTERNACVLRNKQPDFKLRQFMRFTTLDDSRASVSPFCLVSRPDRFESSDEFMAHKFLTCNEAAQREKEKKESLAAWRKAKREKARQDKK